VPGLIEGAHEGHGLGDKFLRHIERTKVLVHLVDVSSLSGRDPVHDFDVIEAELRKFSPAVAAKPRLVAANKIDALDEPGRADALEAHVRERGLPFFRISGVSGAGVDGLVEAMWHAIATAPPPETTEPEAEQPDGPNLLSPSRLHRHA
jgi:GTP-binding protein